jgi:hypothetical protein
MAGSPQVGRIAEHRVDHQRLAPVIFLHPEPDFVPAGDRLGRLYPAEGAADVLVDCRCVLPDLAELCPQYQIAPGFHLHLLHAVIRQANLVRVRTRRHHEVVLQLPPIAVVDQVDARIGLPLLHPRVGGDVGPPLVRVVAPEVIGFAWKHLRAAERGAGARANQPHPDAGLFRPGGAATDAPRLRAVERESGLGSRQRQDVSRSARLSLHRRM